MKDEHNIDRLFQESFKDFEASPPENAWGNIERRLKADSGRKPIPLWRRLTAAVAVIALLIFAVSQWYISPKLANPAITDNSTNGIEGNTTEESDEIIPNQEANPIVLASSSDDKNESQQGEEKGTPNENVVSTILNPSIASNDGQAIAMAKSVDANSASELKASKSLNVSNSKDVIPTQSLSSSVISFPQDLTFTQLSDGDKDNQIKDEQSLIEVSKLLALEDEKRKTQQSKAEFEPSWSIKPQVSPVFYGNMASGSSIDENLAQNNSQGEVDLSYGLNVGYQLTEKIKIRTGINRVNLNYTTNDLFVLPGADIASLSNVNSADGVIASVVTSQQLDAIVDSQQFGRQEAIASDLRQSIGFIEFPLEVEYRLLDKKFGINIIGGASTFLLNDNSLDIINNQGTTSIGEANNINDLSFSTNLALGFDYMLSNRFLLNLEPTFKYQLNTFESGTTEFQPYFLGIYTGLIFKF